MSSSFVANLNLNTQDVEEGQLPNYAMPTPNNPHFQSPYPINPHTNPPSHLNDSQQHHPTLPPHPTQILQHSAQPDIEYETVKHNQYQIQNGSSAQARKKSHKSSHKSSRHYHNDTQRDREREKQKNRYDRKQKQKEIYGSDRPNYPKDDNNTQDIQKRHNPYQAPPFYNPYMYPPMLMIPHHIPPHMFPYPMPPPGYMHPNSYPYPPPSMMPPMSMPSGALNYQNSKNGQPYAHQPPNYQKPNDSYRSMPNERMMREEPAAEKSSENNYKMFGMGGGYMYPYPPPPMPYPAYPPTTYLMYKSPQGYEQMKEAAEKEEQLKLSRKKQYIDNQKQKIRKSLKHLPNQQKIQILQTIRNIIKFDNSNSEPTKTITDDYTTSSDIDLLRKKTEIHCLERSLLKVEEWLKQQDEKIRDTASQLLTYFELNNIKNKIKELKVVKAVDQDKGWSQSRRLLSRLIRCPQQKIV